MVCLNIEKGRKRNMVDHAHALLEFFPAGGAKLKEKHGEHDAEGGMSMHRFAPSEMVRLDDAVE